MSYVGEPAVISSDNPRGRTVFFAFVLVWRQHFSSPFSFSGMVEIRHRDRTGFGIWKNFRQTWQFSRFRNSLIKHSKQNNWSDKLSCRVKSRNQKKTEQSWVGWATKILWASITRFWFSSSEQFLMNEIDNSSTVSAFQWGRENLKYDLILDT